MQTGVRHIFLNSIIIKQVKSSDAEWLCSGWSCQKAVAERVGGWLSCLPATVCRRGVIH